jgi:hypothetical protein
MSQDVLSIKLRCSSWQQLATIYKRDLSRGTMFLRASTPPPIGTSVRIDLTLPSASVIVLTGVVQQHVNEPQRGTGVELKLAPIPTGSIWMIESALAADQPRPPTPASGVPQSLPPTPTGPVASVDDGTDMTEAETELIRALMAEADSLKKLNPFLVLGVGYEASDAEVRSAFGELTKRYHPDRFARYESPELRAVAAEIFILIRDAYRRLVDVNGRSQVLSSLGRTPAPRAVPGPRSAAAAVPPPPAPRGASVVARVPDAPLPGSRSKTPQAIPIMPAPRSQPSQQPQAARKPAEPSPHPDHAAVEDMLDAGRIDDALAAYRALAKKQPQDRMLRAGIELCEGMRALALRDRLEAAQRFETALEIDPSNERAARELAEMRRQATNERKGLLSRLMGKKEP